MAQNFFKVDKGLTLATNPLPGTPTEGDVVKDSADNKFKFYENGVWKKLGSGSGSGSGAESLDLRYLAELQDSLTETPGAATPIDTAAGKTDVSNFNAANEYIRFSYDATKTVTGTGTAMTLSGAPTFTVKQGDILVVGLEARAILTVTTQTSYVLESAFTTNPAAAAACVSQAVYTKDLNGFTANGTGLAVSSQITTNVTNVLVNYEDTATLGDIIADLGVTPHIRYQVTGNNIDWSNPAIRSTNLTSPATSVAVPVAGSQFRIRFFANKTSGSGQVNLLGYKAFWHEQLSEPFGSSYNTAFANLLNSQFVNVAHSIVGGKSRFTFTFPYGMGLNPTSPSGSALEVFANGQQVPRFTLGVTATSQASFTEVTDTVIDMDADYSTSGIEFMFKVPVTVVDSNTSNTNRIASLEQRGNPNLVINGNFDFWQRNTSASITSGLTTFVADRFVENRVGSTAAVSRQSTNGSENFNASFFKRTVVTSVVGSGNYYLNEHKMENVRELSNKYITISFWAKADANKNISLELVQSFGTGGSPSAAVVGIGSEKIAITSTWTKYTKTLLVPSISGKTLGTNNDHYTDILFWFDAGSDHNARSASLGQQSGTFDLAQIKIEEGLSATPFRLSGDTIAGELINCQRFFEKSYNVDAPPGTITGNGQIFFRGGFSNHIYPGVFSTRKRTNPTFIVYNPVTGASGSWRDVDASANRTPAAASGAESSFVVNLSGLVVGNALQGHWTADAEF